VEKIPFCEIKDFHVEILRSIERGQKSWSDSFSEEQARTLVSTFKAKLSISIDRPLPITDYEHNTHLHQQGTN
jgi:hypothetical protein